VKLRFPHPLTLLVGFIALAAGRFLAPIYMGLFLLGLVAVGIAILIPLS
jgi:hypothetical protein